MAMAVVLHNLESVATDEVVVELDEAPVSQFPRRDVVTLYVGRDEAATQLQIRLPAVTGEPATEVCELICGVDRRTRIRHPSALENRAEVGLRASLEQPEALACGEDRIADGLHVLIWTGELGALMPGHAVAQHEDAAPPRSRLQPCGGIRAQGSRR